MGLSAQTPVDVEHLAQAASRIRANCIRYGHAAGPQGAHFGPALSLVEIMTVLYGRVLNLTPRTATDPGRDRMILSKGHGSLALYCALHEFGFIDEVTLETCETDGSVLPGQPIRNVPLGIEFSSGSLGMGLSYGVGLAHSAHLQNSSRRVFVVMGDGETNEGSVWEAAMVASHYKLANVTAIVDVNDLQSDGRTEAVLRMDHQAFWGAAGWDVVDVADGHDLVSLSEALDSPSGGRPKAVLARTVKGKGVAFMEDVAEWHHGRMSDSQAQSALAEIGDAAP